MGTPDPLGDSKLFPNEKQIVVSTNFFLMKRKIIILIDKSTFPHS
jgi:hypothetical protein